MSYTTVNLQEDVNKIIVGKTVSEYEPVRQL